MIQAVNSGMNGAAVVGTMEEGVMCRVTRKRLGVRRNCGAWASALVVGRAGSPEAARRADSAAEVVFGGMSVVEERPVR